MVVGGGLKYWPERERGLPPGQGLRSKPLGMAHARWHLPVPWRGEGEGDRPVLCSGAPPAWGCLGMRVGLLSEMPPGSLDDFTRGRAAPGQSETRTRDAEAGPSQRCGVGWADRPPVASLAPLMGAAAPARASDHNCFLI